MNRGNQRIQQMTILAMLAALAYIVMVVGRIPVVLFLKYDPKDVVIAISGLLYGPLSAMSVSLVVSLVEMLTVSDTGFIGMVMNFLSSATFSWHGGAAVLQAPHAEKRGHRPGGGMPVDHGGHDPVELPDYTAVYGLPARGGSRHAGALLPAV